MAWPGAEGRRLRGAWDAATRALERLTWDALLPALVPAEALADLERAARRHGDPSVMDAFLYRDTTAPPAAARPTRPHEGDQGGEAAPQGSDGDGGGRGESGADGRGEYGSDGDGGGGMGAHFDPGLLTVKPVSAVPGLEVWCAAEKRWVRAEETSGQAAGLTAGPKTGRARTENGAIEARSGAFFGTCSEEPGTAGHSPMLLVLAGEALETLTGGHIPAAKHRVRLGAQQRLSLVYEARSFYAQ